MRKETRKREGKGTYTFANGDKYVGDFVDDRREGKGTLTWVNGDKYEGDFVDGKREGEGIFYNYEDGKVTEGKWLNGNLID